MSNHPGTPKGMEWIWEGWTPETVLTVESKASDVLECAINAIEQMSDNYFIYDDDSFTNIEIKDARMVVTNLRSKGL